MSVVSVLLLWVSMGSSEVNCTFFTLRAGDADFSFYITTVQDG